MQDLLAPIRLSIEQDGIKYVDAFTWNVNDATLKANTFADLLVQDMELPTYFAALIAVAIDTQLEEFASLNEVSLSTP